MLRDEQLNGEYRESLAKGDLVFQRCRSCSNAWLPPRSECPICLNDSIEWEAASGYGRLVTWTIYHIAYSDKVADCVPYNLAVIELDEGVRMVTNIINPDELGGMSADKKVEVCIESRGKESLALFRLCADTDSAPDADQEA